MMVKIETPEQARNYVGEMESYEDYSEVDPMKVIGSLSVLAKSQDEKNYRKVVDSFVRLTKQILPSHMVIDRKLKENPLSFLEFLCIFADGNQDYFHPYREPTLEQVPIGEHQSYFNKLYGEHFY